MTEILHCIQDDKKSFLRMTMPYMLCEANSLTIHRNFLQVFSSASWRNDSQSVIGGRPDKSGRNVL